MLAQPAVPSVYAAPPPAYVASAVSISPQPMLAPVMSMMGLGPARVVTGPVIGTVTSTTARVLVEVNVSRSLTVQAIDPLGQPQSDTQTVQAGIPCIFRCAVLVTHGMRDQAQTQRPPPPLPKTNVMMIAQTTGVVAVWDPTPSNHPPSVDPKMMWAVCK